MLIKSPQYKDYYDHIAHKYGGGDPKIVYARDIRSKSGVSMPRTSIIDPNRYVSLVSVQSIGVRLAYLVVAGRGYVLKYDGPIWPTSELGKINLYKAQPLDWIIPEKQRNTSGWWGRNYAPVNFFGFTPGEENKAFIEMSRVLKQPVFAIMKVEKEGEFDSFYMSGNVPILGDVGFPSLMSPEHLYQDLSYFVGNTMNPSPDVKPPVEVSNQDKIVAAGFDPVISFRHRK